MAANVRITVDLDANQATQVAGKLSQVLAEASINGARVQVGSPEQVKATSDQAAQLNQIVKQILISTERLNIALAKTAKLTFELNRGKGALSPNKKAAYAQFDNIITSSEAAIKQIQNNFIPAVQSVQPAAQKTATETKKVGDAAQKAANTGRGAFKGFTSEMKTSMTTAQALAKSFFSPITIAIIAFEAVVKTFTYFWDNLTESIQKMTTRAQTAIKAIQRKQKAVEQETKASKDLIKQLEELNKQQNLSIDQQRVAESIIAKLNKQYKDLGITLDETTGKYINLYQAQRKIDERNRRSQANALQKEITAQRDIVNAALANAFGRGINLDKMVNGSDFFTLAEKIGGTLGTQNADLLAKKWNTKDLQKQLEVIDQLIQGLSSSDQVLKNGPEARQALQTLIDYKQQLKDLNSVDTQIIEANKRLADSFKQQADALKATKNEIDQLNKSYEDQQRANSLAGLDPEDRANALRSEVEQLRKRDQLLQKAYQYGEQQSAPQRQQAKEALKWLEEYQNGMRASQQAIKSAEEKMEHNKKVIASLLEKYRQAEAKATRQIGNQYEDKSSYRAAANKYEAEMNAVIEQNKKVQQEQVSAQKQLNNYKKAATELQIEYQKQNGVSLEHEKGLANIEKERQQILNQIQQREQQIAQIEKELEEERAKAAQQAYQLEMKQKQAIDDIYKSYQKQIEAFNKTPFQIKIEDALQSAQKSKGADLTREEIDNITLLVRQLERLNELEQERKRRAEEQLELLKQQEAINQIYADYQRQIQNYNKSAQQIAIEEALINAQRAKGADLTRQQIDNIIRLVTELDKLKQLEAEREKIRRQEQAIADIFTNYENSQAEQYLKIIGKQKESLLLEAKINAERAKGAALTEQEMKSLEGYIEVEDLLNQLKENQNQINKVSGEKIISNDLASKGGFASSIVVDRSVEINEQILQVQKSQRDLLSKVSNSIEKYSVIQ